MIIKYLKKFAPQVLITLLLLTYFIPSLKSIDRIGNQWLYLSIINLLGIIWIFFDQNFNFKLLDFRKVYIIRWYLLFILMGLLSFISSNNIPESVFTFNQYLNCFIALSLIFHCFKKIKYPELFTAQILFTLLIFELYYSFKPILDDIMSDKLVFRSLNYSGLAANINITSFSIAFKIPILIYFLITQKKLYVKILLSILLSISLFTIFILGTRGAILALLISFGFYLIYLSYNYLNFRKELTNIILIVLAIILSFSLNIKTASSNNNTVINRASTISLSTTDGSVNQRLRYYKQGLNQFTKTPLLGIGIGNWKLNSIMTDKDNIIGYTVPYHAHNDFIQILAEQGIFALIFYILVFASFIYIIIIRKLYYKNIIYIFFTASFFVFFLDSNLNFPIARPISQLQYILILALVSTKQEE